MPDKDFKTLFNELLHNYGMGVKKLAETTGIPERYLEAMRAGNDTILPPDPYVRGYLVKIVAITGGNLEELMAAYKLESLDKTSGYADRLPSNRFSLRKISKGRVFLSIIVILLLIYGIFRLDVILGKPDLIIRTPVEELVNTSVSTILIEGEVSPNDKLTVNGENVIVESDGTFKSTLPLTPGMNTFEIKTKRFLGKEMIVIKKVVYTPQDDIRSATSTNVEVLPF